MQVKEAELKKAVDMQMQLQREQHQKQVNSLREEIHQKEAAIEQLKEYVPLFVRVGSEPGVVCGIMVGLYSLIPISRF